MLTRFCYKCNRMVALGCLARRINFLFGFFFSGFLLTARIRRGNVASLPLSNPINPQPTTAMRIQSITCKSRSTAARRAPWAAKIAKVEGGFIAFESIADYQTWRNQK